MNGDRPVAEPGQHPPGRRVVGQVLLADPVRREQHLAGVGDPDSDVPGSDLLVTLNAGQLPDRSTLTTPSSAAGSSCMARSPSDTTPATCPSSMTGSLRTSCSRISWAATAVSSSA